MQWFWDHYASRTTAPTRRRRRCGPPTCPACRRRWSSPASSTRCATRATPTREALAAAGVAGAAPAVPRPHPHGGPRRRRDGHLRVRPRRDGRRAAHRSRTPGCSAGVCTPDVTPDVTPRLGDSPSVGSTDGHDVASPAAARGAGHVAQRRAARLGVERRSTPPPMAWLYGGFRHAGRRRHAAPAGTTRPSRTGRSAASASSSTADPAMHVSSVQLDPMGTAVWLSELPGSRVPVRLARVVRRARRTRASHRVERANRAR